MPLVKSIGVIVFRHTAQGRLYLMLHHRGIYWNFPKGRSEAHEMHDELRTAFRELEEETGIPRQAIRLLPDFRATYRYHFRGVDAEGRPEHVRKLAVFYLGELLRPRPVIISDEHLGAEWCDANAAWRKLYYANGRKVLRLAEAYLHRKPLERRGRAQPRPTAPAA
ncbi:MAG: NUDIX domain-containing protein [Patescibacteria group bacterium]|nr:NUDIX domain-containing protein [Patescibacteria group bacterium]